MENELLGRINTVIRASNLLSFEILYRQSQRLGEGVCE